MTAYNCFITENQNQRHSAPMSFFGANFCAAKKNNAILNNTALSVLFFLFVLAVLLVPVLLCALVLLAGLICAVSIHIYLVKFKSNKLSYYKYKAE